MQARLKISNLSRERERVQAHIMDERDLEKLLDLWREWSQSNCMGSGFKNRTIEHQLMIEGAVTRATGSHVMESPECERLDAEISTMPPTMKKAVKYKYLFGWTNKDASKKMGMGIDSYKVFMGKCRVWLCAKMTK